MKFFEFVTHGKNEFGKIGCCSTNKIKNLFVISPLTKFLFYLSGDLWIATTNGSAFVTWDEPIFADNVRVEKVINKGGLKPGQALQWGTYDVAYVAYDEAGNTAQCDFKIYVLSKFNV